MKKVILKSANNEVRAFSFEHAQALLRLEKRYGYNTWKLNDSGYTFAGNDLIANVEHISKAAKLEQSKDNPKSKRSRKASETN